MKANLLGKLWRIARQLHTGGSLRARCNRVKFCVRGLVFPRVTAGWLEFLEQPALQVVVQRRPKLIQKLQRPYLTRMLGTAQRREMLEHHYRYVLSQVSPGLLGEIYSSSGKSLADLPTEGNDRHELRLKSSWMDKEGELALALCHRESGNVLFCLTFSVIRGEAGQHEIVIGGLQGNKGVNDRELIVALTRQWHGLRPKALLLFALQQLAAGWGVGRIRAVSDATHIYRHWHRRLKVASSYDGWWQEAGGQLAGDGLFDLPARFEPRPISSVKANKRQMYRRRYEMLEALGGQIAERLGCLPPTWETPREPVPMEMPTQRTTPRLVAHAVQPLAG